MERMFGIGPTELAFFLVIVLLAVGPERLPTFMRTVGKGMRQIRNASREFKEAIGFDELMREGDPFKAPPVRPPRARPVPVQSTPAEADETKATPPPTPRTNEAASPEPPAPTAEEAQPSTEPDPSSETKHP
ncbi:MAG: twin-arginine translocase TatA/TatE family subunit [Deltaproteobacteria bacterium]|nr:twin-arginine translocase TatA/TatE family subunit [Deltaproteobacteria bacterium]